MKVEYKIMYSNTVWFTELNWYTITSEKKMSKKELLEEVYNKIAYCDVVGNSLCFYITGSDVGYLKYMFQIGLEYISPIADLQDTSRVNAINILKNHISWERLK